MPHQSSDQHIGSPEEDGKVESFFSWLGQREFGMVLALFVIVASVWGFVEIADKVFEGDTEQMDTSILMSMRNANDPSDPIGPGWVEEIGRDFTALGGVGILTILSLGIVGYLALVRKRRAAVLVLVAVAGGLLISMSLKSFYERPRPELVPHGSITYTASFPSGHSMMSAVTYLTLGALLARTQRRRRVKAYVMGCAALLTLAIGVSRVYLGVHWPTDVLAGWTAGAGWALLCWLVAKKLQKEGAVEPED